MKRTPFTRSTGLTRGTPLASGSQLARSASLQPSRVTWASDARPAGSAQPAVRQRQPIRKVSPKRARQNRERAAMADRRWPDRREGTVMCSVPWCTNRADDLHETLTRARGGDITDEDITVPLCRQHNSDLSQLPESELQWAYELGLLMHSWDKP